MSAAEQAPAIELEDLASYVVQTWLRRREYCEKYEVFAHQLVLRMNAQGVKTLDVGDYTIRLLPETRRKEAACYVCNSLLGDNNQPMRISIKKVDAA